MALDASLDSENQTSATLTAGGNVYQLATTRVTTGASVALNEVVSLLEAEDWAGLYAKLHSRIQGLWGSAEFATMMSAATAPHGVVEDVTVVSGPTLDPPGHGWDVARSELEVTMLKDGRRARYAVDVDLVHDSHWRVASIGSIEPDTTAPTSSAGPLEPTYQTASIDVPFVASDAGVGVSEVELWWRFRPDSGSAWGAWNQDSPATTSPISFAFASGDGLYEFYTVAVDNAGNPEVAPALADAATEYRIDIPVVTERVSESSQRGQGNGLSHEAYISADGRYVTFESAASDVVSGDTNAAADIFVHDRLADTTTRVSVTTGGSQGNGSSEDPSISPDGRYVAYRSAASNLVSGDTNNKYDIFLFDRQTGTTTRVSVSGAGAQATGASDSPVVTRDGTAVVFRSFASNLVAGDTNGETDIFVRDIAAGTTTRVSVSSSGAQANAGTDGPTISDDGAIVAFDSTASNLVAGDSNAVGDVFVHVRATGATTRVSVAAGGTQGNGTSWEPTLDADGSVVAFSSGATNLVTGDTNAKDDVFVVTRSTGVIVRASIGDDEVQSTNHADETSLSADGTRLAFYSTASNLVAGDTNAKGDVFVRDLVNGTTTRWSLTSDGLEGNDRSANPTISGDGATVAFHSFATNLVPNDTNNVADVFVRGGQ